MKIKQKKPSYIYRNGLELDFYFKNTLIEVKFDRELEGKQKTLFDEFSTQNKIIINGMDDFLDLE